MVGQAGPPVLRANFESVPSRTLQGLIKPSHSPGIWTDLSVPQVEGKGQPPRFFQQPQQDKDSLSDPSPSSEHVCLFGMAGPAETSP